MWNHSNIIDGDSTSGKLHHDACISFPSVFGMHTSIKTFPMIPFKRSHGCSWPIRNVTLFRLVQFRIRTCYVYKHTHLYACILKGILVLCIHWFIVKILIERMTQWKHVTIRFRTVSDQCFLWWTQRKIQHEQGYSTSAGIGFLIWYTRYCFLVLIKEKKCHSTKWYIGCSQQIQFKEEIQPRYTPKIQAFEWKTLWTAVVPQKSFC